MKVEFNLEDVDRCNGCPFLLSQLIGSPQCRISWECIQQIGTVGDLNIRLIRPEWCKDKHGE